MRNLKMKSAALGLMAALWTAQALAAGQWLHVRVENAGEEETVKVNVPLALAESVLPMLEEHEVQRQIGEHGIRFGHRRWSTEELREAWEKAKAERDFEFLTAESRHENIRVALEGQDLVVRGSEEGRQEFEILVPTKVVDALLSGSGEELDFRAALEALGDLGSQQVVLVKGEEGSTVRLWIDQNSGQ